MILGCKIKKNNGKIIVDSKNIHNHELSENLNKKNKVLKANFKALNFIKSKFKSHKTKYEAKRGYENAKNKRYIQVK